MSASPFTTTTRLSTVTASLSAALWWRASSRAGISYGGVAGSHSRTAPSSPQETTSPSAVPRPRAPRGRGGLAHGRNRYRACLGSTTAPPRRRRRRPPARPRGDRHRAHRAGRGGLAHGRDRRACLGPRSRTAPSSPQETTSPSEVTASARTQSRAVCTPAQLEWWRPSSRPGSPGMAGSHSHPSPIVSAAEKPFPSPITATANTRSRRPGSRRDRRACLGSQPHRPVIAAGDHLPAAGTATALIQPRCRLSLRARFPGVAGSHSRTARYADRTTHPTVPGHRHRSHQAAVAAYMGEGSPGMAGSHSRTVPGLGGRRRPAHPRSPPPQTPSRGDGLARGRERRAWRGPTATRTASSWPPETTRPSAVTATAHTELSWRPARGRGRRACPGSTAALPRPRRRRPQRPSAVTATARTELSWRPSSWPGSPRRGGVQPHRPVFAAGDHPPVRGHRHREHPAAVGVIHTRRT